MKKLKSILSLFLIAVAIIAIWQHEMIGYGVSQGAGQLKIVWNSKPVLEVLADNSFPDSLKQKINLVQEIRKYCFDSLGLNRSENYTTVYNQHGKPVLWVVTACAPFELKAREWDFPLLGSFSYKGFFSLDKAKEEEAKLIKEGLDTSIDEVGGWSTLGWFKDPILTNMLYRSEGSLADLITHELTHGTLYIKNNVDFNENLASFVGEQGALQFLEQKFGRESKQFLKYQKSKAFYKQYTVLVLLYSAKLGLLYNSFAATLPVKAKLQQKRELLQEFVGKYNVLIQQYGRQPKLAEKMDKINNTYFMDVKRYRENLSYFEKEYTNRFDSDFKSYLTYLKNKYPSL